MKTATLVVTMLSMLPLFAGPVSAQQWSGVAGIAAGFGYSASPGMPMPVQPVAAPVEVSQDVAPMALAADRHVASVRHRAPARVMAQAATRRHVHYDVASRTVRHPSLVARAKRMGVRHRARLA